MHIGVIARWLNPVLTECVQLLRDQGVEVTPIFPDQMLIPIADVKVEHDLYLMKAGTNASHYLAGILHAKGARFLNRYPIVALLRDKFRTNHALHHAGVRVPETFMASTRDDVLRVLADGPVVVKPPMGSRGIGVAIVHAPADLDDVEIQTPTVVQRYCPADDVGFDHKVFRIGDRLFGVRRRWPLRNYDDKRGEPFEVGGELEEITRAVGSAFDIQLYGVDIVVSGGKPYVVDVNKFGSYMGVPGAPALLADFILQATRQQQGD